jgi:uncharacterized surface anchored protein
MVRIVFRDRNERPVAGAVVAITTAPAEMTDIGYVTDDQGAIALSIPAPGSYGFTLTRANGGRMIASKRLSTEGEVTVTAHAMG